MTESELLRCDWIQVDGVKCKVSIPVGLPGWVQLTPINSNEDIGDGAGMSILKLVKDFEGGNTLYFNLNSKSS